MAEPKVVKLTVKDLTPENFAPYGQVITVSKDGKPFGCDDAKLELSKGIPRFYLMRLENRAMSFPTITFHANVTQCLGSVNGQRWYLGVAPSTIVEKSGCSCDCDGHAQLKKGKGGYVYLPPAPEDIQLFRVEGPQFLKLHVGTWHAGPVFQESFMDFYNLELSDTNAMDHTSHSFIKTNGLVFEVHDPSRSV